MKQLQPVAVSAPTRSDEEGAVLEVTRPLAKRRFRRHWRLILVVSMALAAVGWSALWLVAAQAAAGNLEDWVAREQTLGREWSCADRQFGGFPFRIVVRCDKPSFRGVLRNGPVAGELGALSATAEVYAPTTMAVAVDGPLDVDSSDRHLHVTWLSAALKFALGTDGFDHASLVVDGPQLHIEAPQTGDLALVARHVESDFAAAPGQPVDAATYDFSLRITDGQLPPLDRVFGDADPATVQVNGVISHLDAASGADFAAAAETWRSAGGGIDLTQAVLHKGASELDASGHLDLDALHRPQGRLDASGEGLEPMLARYGVPRGALAIDSLLTGLLGKPTASGAATLSLPLRLQNGRIFAGPARLPFTLLPLY